jgi:hypothetical protein
MTAFKIIESMLKKGMVQGQMHVCLRNAGCTAGGMAAARRLISGELEVLGILAVSLAINECEAHRKWEEAVAYGRKYPLHSGNTQDGSPHWNSSFGVPVNKPVEAVSFAESIAIPPPAADWARGDFQRYIEAVFEADDKIAIVSKAWKRKGEDRWLPEKGICNRTRNELIAAIQQNNGDLSGVIGAVGPAGAWVRINPLDGNGMKDANVTAFRHALIEGDAQDLESQLGIIRKLQLPCSAIVHSGNKSLHAIVRVDAANAAEYRTRVNQLYAICKASGLKVDKACRNPSRLSRLPGVLRGDQPQYMIDGHCGLDSWAVWMEHVGGELTNASHDESRDKIRNYVEYFNEFMFVVPVGAQTLIGRIDDDGELVLSKPADMKTLFANALVFDENGRECCAFDLWLKDPQRRTYHKIIFDPSGKTITSAYNLWKGFAITPKPGNWNLMADHIREIICGGIDAYFQWFIAWLAHLLQHPAEKPGTAIVLRGIEGAGKGIVFSNFGAMLGRHYLHLCAPNELVGRFSAHLRTALFVFADEALFAGDKQVIGKLKALITEKYMQSEAKFQDSVKTENHARIVMASNESWVIPAGPDARRFFVLDVLPDRKDDISYFSKIQEQMDNGGREAWMHYLMNFRWQDYNLRVVPKTKALANQKLASLDNVGAFWQACLDEGTVFLADKDGHALTSQTRWPDVVETGLFHSGFLLFCRQHGRLHPQGSNVFFSILREQTGHLFERRRSSADPRPWTIDLPSYDYAVTCWNIKLGNGGIE